MGTAAQKREWYRNNPEKVRAANLRAKPYKQAWYKANAERICADRRSTHIAAREQVIAHYGGQCACCGESLHEFLGIDHIEGGGKKHRNSVGDLMKWLIRHNFPPGFQLLCHNCNLAKGFYGRCPHGDQASRS